MDKNAHFEMFENTPTCNMDLRLFYEKMVEENKLDKVFFDGSMRDVQDFTNFVKENTWFFFGFDRYSLVGGVWFTHFLENSCQIHICSFCGYNHTRFQKPIKKLLDFILDNKSFMCYKIIAKTPYKGIARKYQDFGFEYKGYEDGRYIIEVSK